MSIVDDLSELVGGAFEQEGLDRSFGAVGVSQRPDLAQFQCNGAMASAKMARRAPFEIAARIVELIADDPRVARAGVAKPGFVNIDVTDEFLAERVTAVADIDGFGLGAPAEPRTVLVDHGGPNVAKALHVGHLRTAVIGESLKRLFRASGHEATSDVHLGDWGLPMGQLVAWLEMTRPELPYFDESITDGYPAEAPVTVEDLQELYPMASGRFKEDEAFQAEARRATVEIQEGRPGYVALWEHLRSISVADMKETYDELGVDFDLWYGEATVADRLSPLVDELIAQGVAEKNDGAVIVEVAEEGDSADIPPLMLLNSRGGATYALTDVATLALRMEELDVDEVVYVVDQRQSLHFQQVFRASRRAGIVGDEVVLEHAANGTVNGPDGKPFRTRDGSLPSLAGMIDEVIELAGRRLDENDLATEYPAAERAEIARLVGLGAMKYGELSNHRMSGYNFDLEKFTLFQGRTGPYLQYVAARMTSLLARLAADGKRPGTILPPERDAERALMLELLRWPEVAGRALETYSPTVVAEYAYELAGAFNRFYEQCHIRSETDEALQASWLGLVETTRGLLGEVLSILVIDVPERM